MYRMTPAKITHLRQALPLLLVVLCASPFSAAGAETLTLSIGDAVRMAVEKNLGLQVATYSPAIAETGIRKARAIYDPLLSALVDHQGSNQQAAPQSFFIDRQRDFHFDASISQLLPSGATTSLSFNNFLSRDNLGLPTSRFAQPQLTLSFSQPLLQGIGREVTERGITTADDATDSALADWTQQALNTAALARNQYLVLVKARESACDAAGLPGPRPRGPGAERGACRRRSAGRLPASGFLAGGAPGAEEPPGCEARGEGRRRPAPHHTAPCRQARPSLPRRRLPRRRKCPNPTRCAPR